MLAHTLRRPLILLAAAPALLLVAAACGSVEEVSNSSPDGAVGQAAVATAAAPTHPALVACDQLIQSVEKGGSSVKIEAVPYAFLTTAGAIVEWDESPQPSHSGYAVPGSSRFRAYPPDTPAVFCYLDYGPRYMGDRKPQAGDPPLSADGHFRGRELFIMVQGAPTPIPVQSGTREQVQPDPPAGAISLIP